MCFKISIKYKLSTNTKIMRCLNNQYKSVKPQANLSTPLTGLIRQLQQEILNEWTENAIIYIFNKFSFTMI